MTNSEEDSTSPAPHSRSPDPQPQLPQTPSSVSPLSNNDIIENSTIANGAAARPVLLANGNGRHSPTINTNFPIVNNPPPDSSDPSASSSSSLSSSTSSNSGSSATSEPPPTLPFPLICAETKVFETSTGSDGGLLVLTNYRLWIQQGKDSSRFNIPLGLIDSVEPRDLFYLHIFTKNGRWARITFPTNDAVLESSRQIQSLITNPLKNNPLHLTSNFAFKFKAAIESGGLSDELKVQLGLGPDLPEFLTPEQRFHSEIARMGFNVQNPWRIEENTKFQLCSSYPKLLIVPNSIDKKKLEQVACFRSARRFPAVVWRHQGNGAVICRCSQPEVGLFGWRSSEDEELVQNIIQACAYQSYDRHPHVTTSQTVPVDSFGPSLPIQVPIPIPPLHSDPIQTVPISNGTISTWQGTMTPAPAPPPPLPPPSSMELVPEFTNVKKLLILDARSYTTAVVNRARGGGCECLEYYPNCEIQFMNLANIHSIRKSFFNLRTLCSLPLDQTNWFSPLEGTKWIQHMSGLMKAALTVVSAVENDGRPVMVHCSDGWDRTPQIVSLAEILLDPYYRSLEGFQVLVEREWLDFGHKFGDRCGQGSGSDDGNERCPVFLQWLDCLHQLIKQYESAFEFNMSFLVKLVQHTYSNLFGTFLCNSAKEREENSVFSQTVSVWSLLRAPKNAKEFRNSLYKSCDTVLWPSCEVRDLAFWSQVYLGYENPHHPSLQMLLSDSYSGLLGPGALGGGCGEPSQENSPAPSVIDEGIGGGGGHSSSSSSSAPTTRLAKSSASKRPPETSRKSSGFLRGRSSSCENLTVIQNPLPSSTTITSAMGYSKATNSCSIINKGGLQRKLSDSSLYAHEFENQKELLEKAMTDLTTSTLSSCSPSPKLHAEDQDQERADSVSPQNPRIPNPQDSGDEDEDEEQPTSESTVIHNSPFSVPHHHYHPHLSNPHLKSIESSTDTLIAGDGPHLPLNSCSTNPTHRDNLLPDTPFENHESTSSTNGYGYETEDLSTWRNMISYDEETGGGPLSTLNLLTTDPSCSICEKGRNLMKKISNTKSNGSCSSSGVSQSVNISSNGGAGLLILPQLPPSLLLTQSQTAPVPHLHKNYNLQLQDKDTSSGSGLFQSSGVSWSSSTAAPPPPPPGRDHYSMDVDGLTHFHDETQFRVNSIVEELKSQIETLQKEVQEYRLAFVEQVSHKCHHQHCSLVDRLDDAISISGSEQHSVLSQSSETSSFEHVEEKDVYPPLWVPDFAVTSCHGCYLKFSLGRRKHHCRACGRVFCSDCSENFISLPQEQIFVPSRVCKGCFNKYGNGSTNGNGANGQLPHLPTSSSSSTESLILITKEQYAQLSETLANCGTTGNNLRKSSSNSNHPIQNGHHGHGPGHHGPTARNPTTTFKSPNYE